MAQNNNSLLGEDVDSWKTMMFIYNSALKEVGTKLDILNDEFTCTSVQSDRVYQIENQDTGEYCTEVKTKRVREYDPEYGRAYQ